MNENKMQVFNNEAFGEIRVVDVNGEPWFVGKDVATALGYSDTNKAIAMHIDDEDKLNDKTASSLGQRGGWLINESGLYSLILSSKLPTAKNFKRWVTSEVLPSIRKNGGYIAVSEKDDDMAIFYRALHLAEQRMKEQDERMKKQTELIEAQAEMLDTYKPKVEYCDTILQSENSLTVTQIAMDYGLTAQRLNNILHEAGVQYKVNKQWVVYERYLQNGYVDSCTIYFKRKSGVMDSTTYTKWTQQGRLFIHGLLTDMGITALMDRE